MHIVRKATDPYRGRVGWYHRPPPSSVLSIRSMRSACACCCTMTSVSSRSCLRYPLTMKSRAETMMAISASQLLTDRLTMSRCVVLLVMLSIITQLGCYPFTLSASVPFSYPPSIHNGNRELSTIVWWQWLIPVIAWCWDDSNTTLSSRGVRCKKTNVPEC